MEILESVGWITLGFAPLFGFMELAWRLRKKYDVLKPNANRKSGIINARPRSINLSSSTRCNMMMDGGLAKK
jgi:hypothetical protein